MRRSLVVSAAVILLAALFVALLSLMAPPTTDRLTAQTSSPDQIHRLQGHESGFHPYLNRQPSFAQFSPVNVVVQGNLTEAVAALTAGGGVTWNQTNLTEQDVGTDQYSAQEVNLSEASVAWGQATGAHRYAYVHDGTDGTWIREDEQLHDGDYFGHRFHARLYASPHPEEDWVAIQAHAEHFDWFTLRHAVDGSESGQRHLETDLMSSPATTHVVRSFLGNDRASDSDGWATVVELAPLAPAAMAAALPLSRVLERHISDHDLARLRALGDRLSIRHAVLAASIIAIVLGVRLAGLLFEHQARFLGPHTIAGVLYPVLAVGLPLATYVSAHGLERRMDAAVIASVALAAAILLDYGAIGVDVLPIDVVIHRVVVVVALGLIAGGAARRAHRQRHLNGVLVTGLVLWTGMLALTLAGWI